MSTEQHRKDAPASVRCFVVTISDTRTADTDTSGDAIAALLTSDGHDLAGRELVKDNPDSVRQVLTRLRSPGTHVGETGQLHPGSVDVVITTGGTGITSRDSTYEAIAALLDKRLDGFGELFRMLSYNEIGSAAMLTRACAGTMGRTAVFSLPGSEHAVRLGMTKLILPEIGHVVRELRR